MKKLMLCLHASSSNIELVERVLPHDKLEVQHSVDNHLLQLIREHAPLNEQKEYALQTMQTLLAMKPDLIFITCSNYIALLDEIELITTIPRLKIDEVWFEQLRTVQAPIKLLFTNKETIAGTMTRLKRYIISPLSIEVILIPELFEWYIAGEIARHDEALINYLHQFNNENCHVVVAQLSMANSAEQFNKHNDTQIVNPLSALRQYFAMF